MPLPPLTETGDLPPGVHVARLTEVLDRCGGGTSQRQAVALRLNRISRIAAAIGDLARLVVFGSFVTAKPEPADVDVFPLMEDIFDASRLTAEARLLFDHAAAQASFGASVFWFRRQAALEGEAAALELWQVKRDGSLRGIVEIVPEGP